MKKWIIQNSKKILTFTVATSAMASVGLAVKATPKAVQLLEFAEIQKGSKLNVMEKIKVTWKPYLPSALTMSASLLALYGLNSSYQKELGLAATAYSAVKESYGLYKRATNEYLGDDRIIREKIAGGKFRNAELDQSYINALADKPLIFESTSSRYFNMDVEELKRICNELVGDFLHETEISLNDIYYKFGLPDTSLGDKMGWKIGSAMLKFEFNGTVAENGHPALVVCYTEEPIWFSYA